MIIENVVTQHAEEAAFLWLLRAAAVRAPHYKLWELAKLDNRVEAHLDGLRIAGDAGWEICFKALEKCDAGEVFAAAVMAFESGRDERIEALLKAGTATSDKARGLVSALGWLPYQQVAGRIERLAIAALPDLRRVGMAAAAVHRQRPRQTIADALASDDALLKARALRAVGELGLVDLRAAVRKNLTAQDPSCRFWAAWCGTLFGGDGDSLVALQTVAQAQGPYQTKALDLALRRLQTAGANRWLRKMAQTPGNLRAAIIGTGALGDPEMIPWLIEHMAIKPLARVAGEAFSMITGVDLAYQDLDVRPPEDSGAGPTEDPADDNVAMDPDDNLPWPNPAAIAQWWAANQASFANGTRHLIGKLLSKDWLQQVLRDGYQRQRAAAALELALLQPGSILFEVRSPGFRQQKALGQSR